MLASEIAAEKIRRAKILASLEEHAGWRIIREQLEAQVEKDRNSLCLIGMPPDKTEELRYRIKMAQWVLASTGLDNAEQVAKWEEDLAFQQKMEKMRENVGLPANRKELPL